jgi:hypothetical protein
MNLIFYITQDNAKTIKGAFDDTLNELRFIIEKKLNNLQDNEEFLKKILSLMKEKDTEKNEEFQARLKDLFYLFLIKLTIFKNKNQLIDETLMIEDDFIIIHKVKYLITVNKQRFEEVLVEDFLQILNKEMEDLDKVKKIEPIMKSINNLKLILNINYFFSSSINYLPLYIDYLKLCIIRIYQDYWNKRFFINNKTSLGFQNLIIVSLQDFKTLIKNIQNNEKINTNINLKNKIENIKNITSSNYHAYESTFLSIINETIKEEVRQITNNLNLTENIDSFINDKNFLFSKLKVFNASIFLNDSLQETYSIILNYLDNLNQSLINISYLQYEQQLEQYYKNILKIKELLANNSNGQNIFPVLKNLKTLLDKIYIKLFYHKYRESIIPRMVELFMNIISQFNITKDDLSILNIFKKSDLWKEAQKTIETQLKNPNFQEKKAINKIYYKIKIPYSPKKLSKHLLKDFYELYLMKNLLYTFNSNNFNDLDIIHEDLLKNIPNNLDANIEARYTQALDYIKKKRQASK